VIEGTAEAAERVERPKVRPAYLTGDALAQARDNPLVHAARAMQAEVAARKPRTAEG